MNIYKLSILFFHLNLFSTFITAFPRIYNDIYATPAFDIILKPFSSTGSDPDTTGTREEKEDVPYGEYLLEGQVQAYIESVQCLANTEIEIEVMKLANQTYVCAVPVLEALDRDKDHPNSNKNSALASTSSTSTTTPVTPKKYFTELDLKQALDQLAPLYLSNRCLY